MAGRTIACDSHCLLLAGLSLLCPCSVPALSLVSLRTHFFGKETTTFSLGFPVRSEVLAVVIVLRRRLRWFVLPGAACSAGLRGLRAP